MGLTQYWSSRGHPHFSPQAALRALQLIFAIIVAALYGVDLHNATKFHTQAPAPWVYAEVVACLSVLTCAGHCFAIFKHAAWCLWDFVLFILWVALFGVFGSIYLGGQNTNYENATSSGSRMKIAVWMDLVNMLLWFASIVQAVTCCCVERRMKRRTDKEYTVEGASDTEYQAVYVMDTQSTGEVEANDSMKMDKGQAGSLGADSTLVDSEFTSEKV